MPIDSRQLFEILAREHGPALSVYLRAVVRDSTLEDDLFQETMLVAWRNLERFDRSRPFGPWLRGIAARLVLAHRRRSVAAPLLADAQTLESLDRRLDALQHLPGDTLDEQLDALRECVASLPEHYRTAITARYADDSSSVERLAGRLAIGFETLKKRLQRGRSLLLDCLLGKLPAEAR